MPYRQRFRNRRRRNYRRRVQGIHPGKILHKAVGAVKSTAASVGKAALPIIMSEAKRFLLDVIATGYQLHGLGGGTPYRAVITTIPRNLNETNLYEDNRTSRKIHCKGLSMRYMIENSASSGNDFIIRMIVAVQDDATQDLSSGFNLWAPIGATRGVKILRDTYLNLEGDQGTRTRIILKKYVKLNHKCHYKGNQVDGTDTDTGTVVVYFVSSGPSQDELTLYGGATLHYHETM